MKSQVLLTVWCNISGEAAGEIWHWSLSGVKGLNWTHFSSIERRSNQIHSRPHFQQYVLIWIHFAMDNYNLDNLGILIMWQFYYVSLSSSLFLFYCCFRTSFRAFWELIVLWFTGRVISDFNDDFSAISWKKKSRNAQKCIMWKDKLLICNKKKRQLSQ